MDFDEEDDDIILLLLVTSGVTNLLSILLNSRLQLVWFKTWLQRRSTKNVYHNIISELKLQDRYDYRKSFRMNSETHFLISCLQFNLT